MSDPPLQNQVKDLLREIRLHLERGDNENALKQIRKLERIIPEELEVDFLKQYTKMEIKLADAVRLRKNAEALLALHVGEEIPEQQLNKIVCGALKNAINDHGPVQKDMIGSAAKRIVGEIKSYIKGKTLNGVSGD